jgi:4'-phosphopantetheinyl transferase
MAAGAGSGEIAPLAQRAEDWPAGPAQPVLGAGEVHVWRADLEAAPAELYALLSAEERARAGAIVRERQRELWSRARGLLRRLLARYVGEDPRSLRLTSGAHGKPSLRPPAGALPHPHRLPPPAFNLSHSGAVALYAFGMAGALGVDVEVPRGRQDVLRLAARALGDEEARRIGRLDPAARERELLRGWTRREAALKCLGTGLGASSGPASGDAPWMIELELGPDAVGALAARPAPQRLCCWSADR